MALGRRPGLPDELQLVNRSTGAVLLSCGLLRTVWVRLSAQSNRTHGPSLRVQLVSPEHPAVKGLHTAAADAPWIPLAPPGVASIPVTALPSPGPAATEPPPRSEDPVTSVSR